MKVTPCPGEFRVHRGKWATPKGMTPQQCTYCEWCVTNQCVQLEEGYTVNYNLGNCLCDCPIKHSHASIQVYDCGNHAQSIGLCLMGTCESCHRKGTTTSSVEKYCDACSALYSMCKICGVTANGKYPMRPITKMLSAENGRG